MEQKMNPVCWFEIPVIDFVGAKAFYEHVLDLTLDEHEMGPSLMAWFPMDQTALGASGGLIKADGYVPSAEGTCVYFNVVSIEAALARATEKAGEILTEKTNIGEHGFIAVLKDPEGNRIGLHAKE
jgi:predicted enzyme related to lactoylglutathione lyase